MSQHRVTDLPTEDDKRSDSVTNAPTPEPIDYNAEAAEIFNSIKGLGDRDTLSFDDAMAAISALLVSARKDELGNLRVNRQGMIDSKSVSKRMEELDG